MRPHFAALGLALAATLLAGCAATPAGSPLIFTAAPLGEATPSDLPRTARPLHYAIAIEPDAAALTFAGEASVAFELYEASDALVLHALELDIAEAMLVAADGKRTPLAISYQPDRQTARFAAGRMLTPGTYRLETRYGGRINTQPVGLFALDYPDKRTGAEVRGLFTQFEAPDARRFAPMFDEPSYKATFDLTAIIPEGQMAVGNMPLVRDTPLAGGRRQISFATSPKMSSYLLFLAVGDFERTSARAADGTELGIVAPVGSGEQARFALASTLPLIPWLEDYFGTDYPLPKLDNVAAPGRSQVFGAMENWGAILTFESILLDDPAITSAARRQDIYATLAHEVSHQWFGNIVTMAWWDDLWLNEGFASWLETKITHQFHPEWQQNLSRVAVRERAMALDSLATTHPVIREVRTVSETAQAFDQIAYAKGESVIAMLEAFAGEPVWQDGLRRYFARHAYGNTTSADLWRAMEEAGATGLTRIAQDFTTQPGVPLVHVAGECVGGQTRLALSQGEFSADRQDEAAARPLTWHVPLWIAAGDDPAQRLVMEGSASAVVAGCGSAVTVNAGQLGYFRTLLSDELAARQLAGLPNMAPIDQLGALRDAIALADAGYQPAARALDLLSAVPGHANPLVAGYAAARWADQYALLGEGQAEDRARLAAMATQAFGPRLAALGSDPVPGERVVETNLRAALIDALGQMGDASVAAEARRRFALLANDPRALDGPLKTTWLALASEQAGEAEWALLARLAATSTSTAERQTYLTALGASRDEALARRALEFAMTGEAGTAAAEIIDEVSVRHPDMAFAFVAERPDAVRALVDPSGWHEYFAFLAANSQNPALVERLDAIRATLPEDEAAPYLRAITRMRLRAQTGPRRQQALSVWLAARRD